MRLSTDNRFGGLFICLVACFSSPETLVLYSNPLNVCHLLQVACMDSLNPQKQISIALCIMIQVHHLPSTAAQEHPAHRLQSRSWLIPMILNLQQIYRTYRKHLGGRQNRRPAIQHRLKLQLMSPVSVEHDKPFHCQCVNISPPPTNT